MNRQLACAVVVAFAACVAEAGEARPPIPAVARDAKAMVPVPRPASDNVAARTEQFNRQAKAGGFDVMFIGDSITHLWEQHGREVWAKRIAPFKAVNFGIGGDTTATVLWRLDHGNLDGALDPKVIVVMLGTNNIGWSPPEETAAALGAILEKLHTRFPKARILLFPIFARDEPGTKLRQINDGVNAIIRQYDGYWNIKYIDLNSRLAGPDGHRWPGLYWDATHLTVQGYEVWADALVPEFQAVLKPANAPAGRLWDREGSLWEEARKFQLTRPLSPTFGWEGPAGKDPAGEGVNICNERLQSSLWGSPERLVLSIGKTDVYDRAHLHAHNGKKPVGQLLLLAEDFAGSAQPRVTTAFDNGVNSLRLTKGAATADLQLLMTRRETNVIAIQAACKGLTRPLAVRLYRHLDRFGHLPEPEAGSQAGVFWIRQAFAADKTFPRGFDYVFAAKVAGRADAAQIVKKQPALGAPVPFRPAETPGTAATLLIPPGEAGDVLIYATVVTRAEAADPLAEAKKRLQAAEKEGFGALAARNEAWYRAMYGRRERGRIFTGHFDDVKGTILPFFHFAGFQSRHTFNSNPDPTRFEGDASYNMLERDDVDWCGLQCFNEELYTGEYVAGRDECVAPYYVNLFRYWRTTWEDYGRKMGGGGLCVLRGYVPPVKSGVYWSPDAPANSPRACDWASMVWAFKCVWDSYDYGGQDAGYLRDSVYPSLRGVADFFAAKVALGADGRYHLEPSQIREEDGGRDAVDCMAAARWALGRAVEASETLNVDADRRAVWKERLAKMAPCQVIRGADGQEVWASLVKEGRPVVAGHGTSHFLVNVADEVNLDSPEREKDISIRSNRVHYDEPMNRQVEFLLGREPDTLCGTSVFANPAWMIHWAQKAGAGDLARPLPLRTRAQKTLACWLEPERLCNSRSGTIHLFPCVPSGFDVAFRDFQARGGFLVSGEWRGGALTYARIAARRDGPCRVMCPWPGRGLRVLETPSRREVAATREGRRYTFAAVAGKEYELSPVAGTDPHAQDSAQAFRLMRHGIFITQTYGLTAWPDGRKQATLDEFADAFDVPAFAEQMASIGVEYVYFTAWHKSMYLLGPNKALEKWLPGHTAKRDLVGEIADALHKKNIKLVIYAHPNDGHDLTPEEQARVGFLDRAKDGNRNYNDFINEVFDELTERYGGKGNMLGYWLDSWWHNGRPVDVPRLRRTVLARAPGAILLSNNFDAKFIDFLCGEGGRMSSLEGMRPMKDNQTWYLGGDWWNNNPGTTIPIAPEAMYRFLLLSVGAGAPGGMTWALSPLADGKTWGAGNQPLKVMQELNRLIAPVRPTVCGVLPSRNWLLPPGTGWSKAPAFVAARSPSGDREYLHVLKPPAGRSIVLPRPVESFSAARLYRSKRSMAIDQEGDGLRLTLPQGENWDALDTVVELTPAS